MAESTTPEARPNQWVPIYISLLAIILAVTSMGNDDAKVEVIDTSVTINDTHAFYQAKSIRQNDAAQAADYLQALKGSSALLSENVRSWIDGRISSHRAAVSKYESDPATGQGKIELLAKAQALEAARDHAERQVPFFEFSELLLQIAIVFASISIVMRSRWVLLLSYVGGAVGVALTINAFML